MPASPPSAPRLLLALLPACAPAALDTGAALSPPAPGDIAPDPASPGAFSAALPGHPASARFAAGGVSIGAPGAPDPLRLRFTAWGPAGRPRAVDPVAPALLACAGAAAAGPADVPCAPALGYAHPGVTAWWRGLDRGVEFGWTVPEPPAGLGRDGVLTFQMELDGADGLRPRGAGAALRDRAGAPWTVSGAVAWDADGLRLPAAVEVDGDALTVRVVAAGAAYPLTVDPVLEAATTTLTGAADFDGFGFDVAPAGDVDGDGFADVIVGAAYVNVGELPAAGEASVFHGGPDGLDPSPRLTVRGGAIGGLLGAAVAGVGDVNGDGYDDVAIGAPYAGEGAGAVQVHLGGPDGVSPTASAVLVGPRPGASFGSAVAGAGDVNGDGYGDLIVGAEGDNPDGAGPAGSAHLYLGAAGGLSGGPALQLAGATARAFFGGAVSAAGDVNGDGYGDVVIGAGGEDADGLPSAGAAHLHLGGPAGLDPLPTATLRGGAERELFGARVAGGGDVNGDGYDDVVIGVLGRDAGPIEDAGGFVVHLGGPSGLSASPALALSGGSEDEGFGWAVAMAGDVDNDGHDDLLIGAESTPSGDFAAAGAAHLHLGGPAGPAAAPALTLRGDADLGLGASVAGAGDVNGDGHADVLIGLVTADRTGATRIGAVQLHLGYADADGDGVIVGGERGTPQDCDDADPAAYPGAPELPGDGVDQDCDGADAPGDPGAGGADGASDAGLGGSGGRAKGGGCGCASGGATGEGGGGWLVIGIVGWMARRRRG